MSTAGSENGRADDDGGRADEGVDPADDGGQDPREEPTSFVKTVVAGISERNVSFMAGSIAYNAFISLIPLLVLVFFLVSAVGDQALAERVTAATEGSLPQSGQDLLADSIEGSVATPAASIIGLVTLLWGSLKIFRGLDTAFSEIYDSTAENSLFDQLRDGLIVFGAIGAALVAAAVASAAFAYLPSSLLVGVLNPILLVAGLTLAFYPMYYFFPDVDVTWREIFPGVVVAAVGWAALQSLFQVYVALAGGGGAGDAIGAILLLLTWLYFGGFVLLIGAVVNAAYGGWLPAEITRDESDEAASERTADDGSTGDGVVTGGSDEPTRGPTYVSSEAERLEARVARLAEERDRLRNDLAAQRSRRYDLEDEVTALEDRLDRLERENDRLRSENENLERRIENRRGGVWRRIVQRGLDRFDSVRVGVVRR